MLLVSSERRKLDVKLLKISNLTLMIFLFILFCLKKKWRHLGHTTDWLLFILYFVAGKKNAEKTHSAAVERGREDVGRSQHQTIKYATTNYKIFQCKIVKWPIKISNTSFLCTHTPRLGQKWVRQIGASSFFASLVSDWECTMSNTLCKVEEEVSSDNPHQIIVRHAAEVGTVPERERDLYLRFVVALALFTFIYFSRSLCRK